ncbi:MAG: ATP-binding cassette domain-containing protein [Phycisphaerales bacterium]|nr:MAG: ATP-binding cassette domain-containing protein [Phycisphaerales bacterium]
MAEIAISIQKVNKHFGDTHAVCDLDLDVPRGSLCGFLGPNGAGKSTTIRMIMSIIYPDTGSIQVLDSSALKNKDRIGYLPEERGLYRKMRVGEFLEYVAKLKGMQISELPAHVREWLNRIDLPDVYRKRCQELSKGMQQKVQFLAAVIHEPELIILDEPFSGLDPVNAQLMTELIRKMNDNGATIIFSTHILHQAEQLCDRIFLINKGIKLLDATLEQIREQFDPRTLLAEPLDGDINLHGIEGVRDVRQMHDSPAMEIELSEGADPQEVMGKILAAGPMRSVELRRLTLDEVFIRQVAAGVGEQAAEVAREELSHV